MRCLIQNTHLGEAHAHATMKGGGSGAPGPSGAAGGGGSAPTFPPPGRAGPGCAEPPLPPLFAKHYKWREKLVHFRVEIFQMLRGMRGKGDCPAKICRRRDCLPLAWLPQPFPVCLHPPPLSTLLKATFGWGAPWELRAFDVTGPFAFPSLHPSMHPMGASDHLCQKHSPVGCWFPSGKEH